ncbi:hypothetical protein EHF33_03205 [Deinococcus psychrotolerans]|uniref:DUF3341 domain-containing protein n=1 Tax=Deinococcus psychrotolerans TaxID=2489213 RepID=A0A3G8YAE7_9DEIO|nr:hypothetical protein [Deinococcus psychrotolerans]AZI41880.1 hypothetical protein EHF33_03205 [Deinococcus psychrotolerans]
MESVVALFSEPAQAKSALQTLEARGFNRDNLGFSINDPVAENDIAQDTGISPEQGAPAGVSGVLRGTGIGILAGLAIALPVWFLIWVFPETRIYSMGGAYTALFGVLGGGGMGGIFGALAGTDHGDYVKLLRQFGIPAADAEAYDAGIRSGHVLVVARSERGSKSDEALNILKRSGAVDLSQVRGSGALASQRGTH